tara:strand:+ start:757 stop:1026 length:270 start_codon:yes stop_codon:yes gene_type:complete
MVCRTKKVSYADKIFVTNTHSAIAHVTRPKEIPVKMEKENSITDNDSDLIETVAKIIWSDVLIGDYRIIDRLLRELPKSKLKKFLSEES